MGCSNPYIFNAIPSVSTRMMKLLAQEQYGSSFHSSVLVRASEAEVEVARSEIRVVIEVYRGPLGCWGP
ncbi:hypothetical protein GJAV_G00187430 [Gymnothorax javanicus]|nr:hypothetical protein GJAV_G00187430 [Gymnothorax javanicus]